MSDVQREDGTTTGKHPAPFTDSIVEELARLIPLYAEEHVIVHDPFAGEGTRLGALCDRLGYRFSGTDLEAWRDRDPRVAVGDSTCGSTYPHSPFIVVTSPTYNNGVNDHFQPKDASTRLTYRVRAGRPLHENNTGRYSGRGSKRGEETYWRITRDVVKCWPDIAIVNVKDSIRRKTEVYPLVALWTDLLIENGYEVDQENVPCPGWRLGRNGQARLDTEAILLAVRPQDVSGRHIAVGES